VLIVIADDENGTTVHCFNCSYQGTIPKVLPEGAEHRAASEQPVSRTGGQRSPIFTEAAQSSEELLEQAAAAPGATPSTGPGAGGGA
jgi:hypothetical protein